LLSITLTLQREATHIVGLSHVSADVMADKNSAKQLISNDTLTRNCALPKSHNFE